MLLLLLLLLLLVLDDDHHHHHHYYHPLKCFLGPDEYFIPRMHAYHHSNKADTNRVEGGRVGEQTGGKGGRGGGEWNQAIEAIGFVCWLVA